MIGNKGNDVTVQKKYLYSTSKGNFPCHLIKALESRNNWCQIPEEEAVENADFYWRQVNFGSEGYRKIDKRLTQKSAPFIFNHFEVINGICTKTNLIKSLRTYYEMNEQAKQCGYSIFDSTPTTFIMSQAADERENFLFLQRYREIQTGGSQMERVPYKHCQENMWVVKPAALNQGRGIQVFKNLKDILEFVLKKQQKETFWVVQKYIERPLLYKTRKFDIRVWCLLTDDFRIYFYRQGYLRTSSSEYTIQNSSSQVHLTNQCLQVHCQEYGTFEEGNTLTFAQFQQYLDEEHSNHAISIEKQILPRMKDLVIDSFLSVRHKINPNRRKNQFELFGFDFLIDEDFRVWLIEINTNPFLGTPNKDMQLLVPKMINELCQIVIDPIFKPQIDIQIEQNDFELIYKEGTQGLNQRRPFSLELCYPIPSLKPFIGRMKNGQAGFVRKPSKDTLKTLQMQKSPSQIRLSSQDTIKALHMQSTPSERRLFKNSKTLKSLDKLDLISKFRSEKKSASPYRTKNSVSLLPAPYLQTVENIAQAITEVQDDVTSIKSVNLINFPHNLLIKTLYNECVEMCKARETPTLQQFDQIVSKVIIRLQQWELFDDEEIQMATKSLQLISPSLISLISDSNLDKLFLLFENEDLVIIIKTVIAETLLELSKQISFRKQFLRASRYSAITKYCFRLEDGVCNEKEAIVSMICIKILINVCSLSGNRNYIPGETHITNQLKKRSFDCGTYITVVHIQNFISENPFYTDFKQYIDQKFFNVIDFKDLEYNLKVVQLAQSQTGQETIKNESEVEKIMFSSRMAQSQEVWIQAPIIQFPSILMEHLNFEQFIQELAHLIEYLGKKIQKRKEQVSKNQKSNLEVAVKELNQEHRRKRAEELVARETDRKKWEVKYKLRQKNLIKNGTFQQSSTLAQTKDKNRSLISLMVGGDVAFEVKQSSLNKEQQRIGLDKIKLLEIAYGNQILQRKPQVKKKRGQSLTRKIIETKQFDPNATELSNLAMHDQENDY